MALSIYLSINLSINLSTLLPSLPPPPPPYFHLTLPPRPPPSHARRLAEAEAAYGRKAALGPEVEALKRAVKGGGGMAFRAELRSMKRVGDRER
jgi:hypothetical protein